MRLYEEVLRHVGQASKTPTALAYLVCATPRSGSTLLCEHLSLTGVAGVPDEWLLPGNQGFARGSFPGLTPFDEPGYLADIIDRSRTPNGVFGVKVMWPELEQLRRGARWQFSLAGSALRHSATLPNVRYVRMSRGDRLRQAISLFFAMKTNEWHRMRKDEHGRSQWPIEALQADLADPVSRTLTLESVRDKVGFIEQQEREWDRFFAEHRLRPFPVTYEELVADPVTVVRGILRFLDVEGPETLDFSRTWHLPMSDGRNELLVEAYCEYAAGRAATSRR